MPSVQAFIPVLILFELGNLLFLVVLTKWFPDFLVLKKEVILVLPAPLVDFTESHPAPLIVFRESPTLFLVVLKNSSTPFLAIWDYPRFTPATI